VLLAFDTATPLVSVALHDGQGVVAERLSVAAMKHGEQLAPLIEAVLAEAGVDRLALTRIAVGTGPGPFTGLRVGLVTARTLGHVLALPVLGVCTLDVIAVEVAATAPGADLTEGFLVATDARRKEVYAASYDSRGRRVSGPSVGSAAEVATQRPVAGVGPGLSPASFPRAIAPDRPSAGWLARAVAGELVELTGPDPMYLRRPDAVAPGPTKRVT
jgi:tRNA threonylcarbamoyladenosine biosynthesis protein TsaB